MARSKFTQQEDIRIRHLRENEHKTWVQIAAELPHHKFSSIKNRYLREKEKREKNAPTNDQPSAA